MQQRTEVTELSNFELALTQTDAPGTTASRVPWTATMTADEPASTTPIDERHPAGRDIGVTRRCICRPRPAGSRPARRGDDLSRLRLVGVDDPHDRLAPFRPAIIAVRWGTVAVGLLLAAADLQHNKTASGVWAIVIVAYAAFRTLRPIRMTEGPSGVVAVYAEVALHAVAVIATGYWDSPFVFTLITAIIVAGFARGFAFALQVVVVSVLAVGDPRLPPQRAPTAGRRPVGRRVRPRRARRRLHPPHLRRGRPPAVARARPAGTAGRRQRPAVLAAPGGPDAAGVARPRRGPRLDDGPAARPVRLRRRRRPALRRDRPRLGHAPGAKARGCQPRFATSELPPALRAGRRRATDDLRS